MPLFKRITLPLTLFLFLLINISVVAQDKDTLVNRPELSLPLTSQKLVIAHCMTHIIRYEGHPFEDACNPEYYPMTNNISASVGGLSQVHVMADSMLAHATLDEAVEYEMRAAKRCGIDGFQFYYTLGDLRKDSIIEAYFRVADKKNIDFKFTFCFSHPQVDGKDENAKLIEFAIRVNKIMEDVGRANPHWLRTPDGRLIVYLWYGEQIADIPTANMQGRPAAYYVARAYDKLANACKEKFACIYSINDVIDKGDLDDLLDYFPGVYMWTQAYTYKNQQEMMAMMCKKRNRFYTASVFSDFYTSKVLKPGTWDILPVQDAVAAGVGGMQRKYMITGLSQTFRKQLEFAIKSDASIINVITWNDYPEGHHLAPEVNHNYGFSVLLNYYKSVWRGEASPYQDRDVAIAFFKKYKSNIKPKPYNVSLENLGSALDKATPSIVEDSIEIVTILPQPAQLVVNGETANVPAGIHSQRFKSQPGAVSVAIQRNGVVTKSFVTPEWITNNPLRTDRLTYSFSTEHDSFQHDIFGDLPPIYSTQYNSGVAKQ